MFLYKTVKTESSVFCLIFLTLSPRLEPRTRTGYSLLMVGLKFCIHVPYIINGKLCIDIYVDYTAGDMDVCY